METQRFIAEEDLYVLVLEAGEEDYSGLYEVIWELNAKFPVVPESEKIRLAREALEECLSVD